MIIATTPGTAVAALRQAGAGEVEGLCQRGHGEIEAERLHSSFFSMPIDCMKGNRGNDLHAGGGRDHAGQQAHDAADPFLVFWRSLELEFHSVTTA